MFSRKLNTFLRTKCSRRLMSNVVPQTLSCKGIDDLPSPTGLPFIGTTLSLIKAGSYPKLHYYIDKRHKELGPIFKESIGPVACVFISDPDEIRSVFRYEGKYPVHVLPEAWTTYNTLYNVTRGLFFMNGEEWLHFRRMLNPLLLKPDNQPWLEDCCQPAIDNLLQEIKRLTSKNVTLDMERLLYQWSLEVLVSVLIGPDNFVKIKDDLQDKIIHLASIVHRVFETSSKLSLIPASLASKYRIPRWKRFEESVSIALSSAADLVQELQIHYLSSSKDGLLGKLREQMTSNELSKIVTDLILAAGDTTATSMEWTLYSVAKSPAIQNNLRQSLKCNDVSTLNNTYVRNVVRESLRLYPVAPFLTRILPEALTIKGYEIPAGTVLILSIFTTGRDERNFENPLSFDPDRWTRNDRPRGGIVQSAALPFAIGGRSCIGRKLAETQLQLTLASIVNSFNVTVDNAKDVEVTLKMVAVPSERIKFNFIPIL